MEYYDEVVEIEDRPGNIKPITESGVIGKSLEDDLELNKPTVNDICAFRLHNLI